MKSESDKLDKVLNILAKSKPLLDSTDDIEIEVIKSIKKLNQQEIGINRVLDFLFGWVYIVWIRRSLIAASIVIVFMFVYQQGVILKRIDLISRQVIVSDKEIILTPADEMEKLLMVYKYSGKKFPSKTLTISESQMQELLKSMKELQVKYKDLENIINSDPELKKQIEKKLLENERTKTNL